jgi:hypothetical protein
MQQRLVVAIGQTHLCLGDRPPAHLQISHASKTITISSSLNIYRLILQRFTMLPVCKWCVYSQVITRLIETNVQLSCRQPGMKQPSPTCKHHVCACTISFPTFHVLVLRGQPRVLLLSDIALTSSCRLETRVRDTMTTVVTVMSFTVWMARLPLPANSIAALTGMTCQIWGNNMQGRH